MEMVAEQGVPPPLSTRDHEVVAPAAPETPTAVTASAGRGVVEASTPGAWSALNLGVIDLDATEL
jgi:hypothetical protein